MGTVVAQAYVPCAFKYFSLIRNESRQISFYGSPLGIIVK